MYALFLKICQDVNFRALGLKSADMLDVGERGIDLTLQHYQQPPVRFTESHRFPFRAKQDSHTARYKSDRAIPSTSIRDHKGPAILVLAGSANQKTEAKTNDQRRRHAPYPGGHYDLDT